MRTVKLSEIGRFIGGGTPSKQHPEYYEGNIPWVSTVALNGGFIDESNAIQMITEEGLAHSATKVIPAGSLMVGTRVGVGKVAINRVPICACQDIVSICGIDESIWDKEFLAYFIISKAPFLASQKRGATFFGIKSDVLKNLQVPAIDLGAQKEIVASHNRVKRLIRSGKDELYLYDELVKARFVEMFEDSGFPVVVLGDYCLGVNNGMARRGSDDDGSIVLRLVELQEGFIDYASVNRIKLTDKEKERLLLHEGDVLFARVNGNPDNVGRCASYSDIGEAVYHNDHVIRATVDKSSFDACFLVHFINSVEGREQIDKGLKTSAGQYTISQDGIRNIILPKPPIETQKEFAAFIQQVDKLKSAARQQIEKLQELYDSLAQDFFGC